MKECKRCGQDFDLVFVPGLGHLCRDHADELEQAMKEKH